MKMQQQTARAERSEVLGRSASEASSIILTMRNAMLWVLAGTVCIGLSLGYGYFLGRYEQIQMNRSVLKPIPDVNCSQEAH